MPRVPQRAGRPTPVPTTSGRYKKNLLSPFNVADEDLDLRLWQTWWEEQSWRHDQMDLSADDRDRMEVLTEKNAQDEHTDLLHLLSHRRKLTSCLEAMETAARMVDEECRRVGNLGIGHHMIPQNIWTKGFGTAQREDIILHCLRIACLSLGVLLQLRRIREKEVTQPGAVWIIADVVIQFPPSTPMHTHLVSLRTNAINVSRDVTEDSDTGLLELWRFCQALIIAYVHQVGSFSWDIPALANVAEVFELSRKSMIRMTEIGGLDTEYLQSLTSGGG
ncbi:hypothetical protein P7C70_g4466, partial [Phenoliferia sp. Uapishka_3]